MKLLLYCTKAKPYLVYHREYCALSPSEYIEYGYETRWQDKSMLEDVCNGKIVAECDYEVENIFYGETTESKFLYPEPYIPYDYHTNGLTETQLCDKSKLNINELNDYLKGKNGYAIHIKNLHIFDKPKELRDYCLYPKEIKGMNHFTLENSSFILISIKPEELCRIANKEQDVLIRRNVLKEML